MFKRVFPVLLAVAAAQAIIHAVEIAPTSIPALWANVMSVPLEDFAAISIASEPLREDSTVDAAPVDYG